MHKHWFLRNLLFLIINACFTQPHIFLILLGWNIFKNQFCPMIILPSTHIIDCSIINKFLVVFLKTREKQKNHPLKLWHAFKFLKILIHDSCSIYWEVLNLLTFHWVVWKVFLARVIFQCGYPCRVASWCFLLLCQTQETVPLSHT